MMAEMFVITFANPKGGSGKTTAALLLTEQLARASDRVAILDCDPNRNIDMWAEERAERGQATPFATLSRPPAGKLPDLVRHSDFDFLVIDLEGTADALVVDALSVSDLCIVPFEPTPMEARQAGRAIGLIHTISDAQSAPIDYAILFTRTNAAFQTKEEREIRTETRTVPLLPPLVRRAAYTRIFRDSSLLAELDPRDVSNLEAAKRNAHDYAEAVARRLTAQAEAPQKAEAVA